MALSSNVTILIIVLCTAGVTILGYVIYRMCWLDRNGRNTDANDTVAIVSSGMTHSHEQQQYMKKVRDRYRRKLEDLEAGMGRYEAAPKKTFWQSVETFNAYEEPEDMYDYDLRSPKLRFGGASSTRSTPDDWF